MVLEYAKEGNFNNWLNENFGVFNWKGKLLLLWNIIIGLKEIHQIKMVHRDFHTGNILIKEANHPLISDMGLCGKVGIMDKTKIYGVMPYLAPEVLRGESYTQAADIYSFAMIMYFVATIKQPFVNRAHDNLLALNICNGIRPEINEQEAPKCYIDLMNKCWDTNPINRPNVVEVKELIGLFVFSCKYGGYGGKKNKEINKQFEEAEKYRKANHSFIENTPLFTHPQACYTSRLLNPSSKI